MCSISPCTPHANNISWHIPFVAAWAIEEKTKQNKKHVSCRGIFLNVYWHSGRPITALAGLSQYIPHPMDIRIISLYIPFLAAANNNTQKQTSAVEVYTQISTGVLAAPAGPSRSARASDTSSHSLFLAVVYSNTEKQTQAVMVYILKFLLASLQHCVTAQTIHRHIIRSSSSLE